MNGEGWCTVKDHHSPCTLKAGHLFAFLFLCNCVVCAFVLRLLWFPNLWYLMPNPNNVDTVLARLCKITTRRDSH